MVHWDWRSWRIYQLNNNSVTEALSIRIKSGMEVWIQWLSQKSSRPSTLDIIFGVRKSSELIFACGYPDAFEWWDRASNRECQANGQTINVGETLQQADGDDHTEKLYLDWQRIKREMLSMSPGVQKQLISRGTALRGPRVHPKRTWSRKHRIESHEH